MEGIDFLDVAESPEGIPATKVSCGNINMPKGFKCN